MILKLNGDLPPKEVFSVDEIIDNMGNHLDGFSHAETVENKVVVNFNDPTGI